MKLHQSLKAKINILLLVSACWCSGVFAQDIQSQKPPLVEVQLSEDNLAPYKERRSQHGAYVAVEYEALNLNNFISTLDNKSYEELFGSEPVPLIRLDVEYKYNSGLGAASLGVAFGKGSVSDNRSGTDRTLDITKYGVGFKFAIDTLMDEPYVVPYGGVNLWQMGISESSPTDNFSATTQMGFNYSFGLLLQLDWLDYQTAKYTTFNWGVENTFLDLFVTQYAKTTAEDDPNTETDMLYGGGIRLEF